MHLLRVKDDILKRCLFVVFGFFLFSLPGALALEALSSAPIAYLFLFCGLLGVIEGIKKCELNLPPLSKVDKDEVIALLEMESDRWKTGLSLFIPIVMGLTVGGGLAVVFSAPQVISHMMMRHITILLFLVLPGIGVVVWELIKKINYVRDKLEEYILTSPEHPKRQ